VVWRIGVVVERKNRRFKVHLSFKELLEDPYKYPSTYALYMEEGKGWDIMQLIVVIDPNEAEDISTVLGKFVLDNKWQYILEMSVIKVILNDLIELVPNADFGLKLKAFVFYFEHDSFIDVATLKE
jgi:hypothetical protein